MKKKSKVRLQDIAEKAELSISAVSLALRDHPSISEETKLRVQQIRRELGYRPAGIPQSANRQSQSVLSLGYCLIGESLQDEAYAPIADGVITACREWLAHLAIAQLPADTLPSKRVTMPTGEEPDGYLLLGFLSDEIIEDFCSRGKPVVVIGSNPLSGRYPTVTADIFDAGRQVARRAINDGYRNFVNISANLRSLHNVQFLEGVRRELESGGFPLLDNQIIIAQEFALHEPQYLDQLSKLITRPTAIFTAGTVTATACTTILQAKGWMKKKELAIYTLRPSAAGDINPHYHSLNLGFERLGQIAVDQLAHKILRQETYRGPSTTLIYADGWIHTT